MDVDGHVLGNFHAYYSFNPVHERLRFMDTRTCAALRKALLSWEDQSSSEDAPAAATVLDVGCNEGLISVMHYGHQAERLTVQCLWSIRRPYDRNVRRAEWPLAAA